MKKVILKKLLSCLVIASFLLQTFSVYGQLGPISTPLLNFNPATLRYLSVNSANPYNYFNFLLDKGNASLDTSKLNSEAKQLINFFFLGITLSDDDFWVNLRPDEPGRITSLTLTKTEMGRILLNQDLQLKKEAARLLHPNNPTGQVFWNKLYSEAEKLLGKNKLKKTAIETSNRVWIVPDEAIVMETDDGAFVVSSKLKVLLENDYYSSKLSLKGTIPKAQQDQIQGLSEQLMREIIIPEITKEVNSGETFAPLRQIYNSLILAQWFKRKYRNSQSIYSQAIGKGSTQGLESQLPWEKQAIWQDYLKSYKQGEYNFKDKIFGLNRMYFSGGMELTNIEHVLHTISMSPDFIASANSPINNSLIPLTLQLKSWSKRALAAMIMSLFLVGPTTDLLQPPKDTHELVSLLERADAGDPTAIDYFNRPVFTDFINSANAGNPEAVLNMVSLAGTLKVSKDIAIKARQALKEVNPAKLRELGKAGNNKAIHTLGLLVEYQNTLAKAALWDVIGTLDSLQEVKKDDGALWAVTKGSFLGASNNDFVITHKIAVKKLTNWLMDEWAESNYSRIVPNVAIGFRLMYSEMHKDYSDYTSWLVDNIQESWHPDPEFVNQKKKDEILAVLGSCKHLNISNPFRFRLQTLQELIKNRSMPQPDKRRLAVIIYPKVEDYEGTFYFVGAAETFIYHGYRVMYYEANTIRDIVRYLKEATRNQKAAIINITGHGDKENSLDLGSPLFNGMNFDDKYSITLDDEGSLKQEISGALEDGGRVVLESCFTGHGREKKKNLANMFRKIFPQAAPGSIFAPIQSTGPGIYKFDKDNNLIDVEFNDGRLIFRDEEDLKHLDDPKYYTYHAKLIPPAVDKEIPSVGSSVEDSVASSAVENKQSASSAVKELESILNNPELISRYNKVAEEISHVAKSQSDIIRSSTISALLTALKTKVKALDYFTANSLAYALVSIAENTSNQNLDQEAISALEGVLETPGLDETYSYAYLAAIGALDSVAQKMPELISITTVSALLKILKVPKLYPFTYSAVGTAFVSIVKNTKDADFAQEALVALINSLKAPRLESFALLAIISAITNLTQDEQEIVDLKRKEIQDALLEIVSLIYPSDNWFVYISILNLLNALGYETQEIITPLDDYFPKATEKIRREFSSIIDKFNSLYEGIIMRIELMKESSFTKDTIMFGSDIDGMIVYYKKGSSSEEVFAIKQALERELRNIGVAKWKAITEWKEDGAEEVHIGRIVIYEGNKMLEEFRREGTLEIKVDNRDKALARQQLFNTWQSLSLTQKDFLRRLQGSAAIHDLSRGAIVLPLSLVNKNAVESLRKMSGILKLDEQEESITTLWNDYTKIKYRVINSSQVEGKSTNSPLEQNESVSSPVPGRSFLSRSLSLINEYFSKMEFGDSNTGQPNHYFIRKFFFRFIFWGSLLMAAENLPEVKDAAKDVIDTYTPFVYTYNELPLSQQAAMLNDFIVDYLKGEDIAIVGFSTESRLRLKAALRLFKDKDPNGYSEFKKDIFAIVVGDEKLFHNAGVRYSSIAGWYEPKYPGEHRWFIIKKEMALTESLAWLASTFSHENMHREQNRNERKGLGELEAYLKGLLQGYKIDSLDYADLNVEKMANDLEGRVWEVQIWGLPTLDTVKILSEELAQIFSRQGISIERPFLDFLINNQITNNIDYRKMESREKLNKEDIEFLRDDARLTFRSAIKFILAENGFYSYSDNGKLQFILNIKKGISTLERRIAGSNYREKSRLLLELGKLRKELAKRQLDFAVANELKGLFVPCPKPVSNSSGSPVQQSTPLAIDTNIKKEETIQGGSARVGAQGLKGAPSPLNTVVQPAADSSLERGGIDLSKIELTLKDEKFVSSLNPADLKILRAGRALNQGWNSLSILYLHEIMLLLKDDIVSDIQNKALLQTILNQLKLKNLFDPQLSNFLRLLQLDQPIADIKIALIK